VIAGESLSMSANLQNNGGSGRGIWLEKGWIGVGNFGDFHAISP
jgi:hypothetical protein